jgi:hypothetical protein
VILAIRATRRGFTVGSPYLRKRRDRLSIELRKPGHHKYLPDALKSLEKRLAQAETHDPRRRTDV